MKNGKNITRRVTGLKLTGEWMQNNIVLCTLLIDFQDIINYWLEEGGRGGGEWDTNVPVRLLVLEGMTDVDGRYQVIL